MENILKKLNHLLNNNAQRFIMCGGIPGAGKSTIVNEFEKIGYNVVCPDRIRVELAQQQDGNENKIEGELSNILMTSEKKVWAITAERIKSLLTSGKSVIFDATNTNIKNRKQVISWSKETHVPVIAVYVECPKDIALQRNEKRGNTITGTDINGNPIYGRAVPDFVIEKFYISQVLPTIQEGFVEVNILHVELEKKDITLETAKKYLNSIKSANDIMQTLTEFKEIGILKTILPTFNACWGIDQKNKHHNLQLHEHMIKAAQSMQHESLELFIATLLHDVGKLPTMKRYAKLKVDTENFKTGDKVEITNIPNKKGFIIANRCDYQSDVSELLTVAHVDIDPNLHYYNHENIGAIMVRREIVELGFSEDIANQVYLYVLYHMALPYTKFSEQSIKKLINKVGCNIVLAMIKLKKADKQASANNDINQYLDNLKKIESMLK